MQSIDSGTLIVHFEQEHISGFRVSQARSQGQGNQKTCPFLDILL